MSILPLASSKADLIIDSFIDQPGLYLHIPFCEQICPFCPYNKVLYNEPLAETYFEALEKEIDWYLSELGLPLTSVYIGGGTPTLCIDQLDYILKKVPVTGEIAIEVLPTHATDTNLARLKKAGINYLSLGIQSFNDSVLDHLKRPHSAQDNHQALKLATHQFDCLDVDLIFDVAFENESTFLHDMEVCFQAGVDQVSTYPLMRFGYTPLGKSEHYSKKEHLVLHNAESLAQQYGYERRSVWTFNRVQSANYTSITREFYLGCGAGAGSFTGDIFTLNHFSISSYIEAINNANLPITRISKMSKIKAAVYYLFWQTYTGTINIKRFSSLYPDQRILKGLLNSLLWSGLFRADGDNLVLTQRGYDHYHDLERWVTYHFIEPLWSDMMHEHTHLKDVLPHVTKSQQLWLRLANISKPK